MKAINSKFVDTCWATVFVLFAGSFGLSNQANSQCDPATINLCAIGNNSIIQASFHAQIAKTSNGYSITGQDFAPSGRDYSTVLTNIPSPTYRMPAEVVPVWGAIGGRTQAVFIATDDNIYAIGEEDLLIDASLTNGSEWGVTNLKLPSGITVCDVNKWQGAAGSGSDNNNGSNATGVRDGFLVFSTITGEAYIIGDGAAAIQRDASNTQWTLIKMPAGVSVVNFGVGYRTLLILGSDGNLYASGQRTYLGDGSSQNLNGMTRLAIQPNISVFGILQIEAGFHSYFVLDGDGTIHVLGDNKEGGLGVGHTSDLKIWSKVGMECPEGILDNVAYISTMSTHDHHISSSAILVDRTIRSWGSNHKQSITSGANMLISCPIIPTGNNKGAVAISNGGHISPYVNTQVEICNIGHNRQGAFGDGQDEEGDYGEYFCRVIPGMPVICGTEEANLALEKNASHLNPSTGEDIVFAITVTNLGPEASSGSIVRDQLSPAFYYLSDDSNGAYDHITGLWKVGPLELGESSVLNLRVKVIEAGMQSNYAQILVDNEVDVNSIPGNQSLSEDDDDLVLLDVRPCPITHSDTLLCPGDSLFINNNWIFESGLYIETIPLAFDCDSLHITNLEYVEAPPVPQFDLDCEEQIFNFSIEHSAHWQPIWGNGEETFQTKYEGTQDQFELILKADPNCSEQFFINLPPVTRIEDIPILEDTTVLQYSSFILDLELNPLEWQVQWSPESIVDCSSCMIGNFITKESQNVTVYLEHISGCFYESSFVMTVEKEPELIYTPNVFSPNGDAYNNEWVLSTSSNVFVESCYIYDRWGSLVFHSNAPIPKWDGRFEGKDCEAGVYLYSIRYRDTDDILQTVSGDLTLLR